MNVVLPYYCERLKKRHCLFVILLGRFERKFGEVFDYSKMNAGCLKSILAVCRPLTLSYGLRFCLLFSTYASDCKKSGNEILKMPAETSKFLRFVRLSQNAFPPSKGSEKAAGFDLKSAYAYVIQPRSKEMVKTDLQIELPEGCYGRIAPRSGLTWKNGIDVGAGVVDEDYRGDIRVILFNHSDEPFIIQPGDRIAQLICERIYYPKLVEVTELNQTSRGTGGFGSTGKN